MSIITITPEAALVNQAIPRYFITPESNETPTLTNYLGNQFYSQVELKKSTSTVTSVLGDQTNNNIDGILLKTCLVTINQTKNIIKTSIAGRNGTIKEYMSDGDYLITVSGIIVNEDLGTPIGFPELEMNAFKEIISYVGQLDIINGLINKFVTRVVVDESGSWIKEMQGFRNQLEFNLNLISDDNPLNFDTASQ